MKPTQSMLAAVQNLPKSKRLAAAKLAEQVFFASLRSWRMLGLLRRGASGQERLLLRWLTGSLEPV